MLWLVNPWREARRLQVELERENAEKHKLADEMVALRARLADIEPRMADALQREANAVKMIADWLSLGYTGRSVFGVGLPLPEINASMEPIRRRENPAEDHRAALKAFYEEAYNRQPEPTQ